MKAKKRGITMKFTRLILGLSTVLLTVGLGGQTLSHADTTDNTTNSSSTSANSGSTVQTKALS